MNIKECKALITGGASGLGEATVRKIVENGGQAVILDLSEEQGKRVVEELGTAVSFIKTDVTSDEEVRTAVASAVNRMGYINTVVNCAGIGIAEKVLGKKGTHSLDLFSKVISVNLIGTFNVCRVAAESMVQNVENSDGERGVIINTASVAPQKAEWWG